MASSTQRPLAPSQSVTLAAQDETEARSTRGLPRPRPHRGQEGRQVAHGKAHRGGASRAGEEGRGRSVDKDQERPMSALRQWIKDHTIQAAFIGAAASIAATLLGAWLTQRMQA